jgi:putative nucleotidyltransferase with HDIG domain
MMDEDAASREPKTELDLAVHVGRWVAMAGEQVAGVGDTALAAERLGRRNRPRERLNVIYVEPKRGQSLALPEQLLKLRPIFLRQDQPIHLVGGAVRDVLMGREIKDLDFVVPSGAIPLAFKVANSLDLPAYILDRQRDAGRVVLADGETTLDFTSYRGSDLLSDLRFRDFTLNAMALPVAANTVASLIDPCDGQADLKAGIIRLTHPEAIADDPARALRAIRHAVDFGFALDQATREAIAVAGSQLRAISVERVRDELLKMLGSDAPEKALQALLALGLLPAVLPEVAAISAIPQTPPHFQFVLAHTASVLASLVQLEQVISNVQPPAESELTEARQVLAPYRKRLSDHLGRRLDGGLDGFQVLRLGALFHDVGKQATMSVEPDGRIRFLGHAEVGSQLAGQRLASLRLSRQVIRHVSAMVEGHMRPLLLATSPQLSRRAIFRFFTNTGGAGLDITILALADQLALVRNGKSGSQWRRLLDVVSQLQQHYFEHFTETVRPAAILDGREVMEILKIEPGPRVGDLLSQLLEAQASGEIESREDAVALVTKLAAEDKE